MSSQGVVLVRLPRVNAKSRVCRSKLDLSNEEVWCRERSSKSADIGTGRLDE